MQGMMEDVKVLGHYSVFGEDCYIGDFILNEDGSGHEDGYHEDCEGYGIMVKDGRIVSFEGCPADDFFDNL